MGGWNQCQGRFCPLCESWWRVVVSSVSKDPGRNRVLLSVVATEVCRKRRVCSLHQWPRSDHPNATDNRQRLVSKSHSGRKEGARCLGRSRVCHAEWHGRSPSESRIQ